jgi:hypothetical protein
VATAKDPVLTSGAMLDPRIYRTGLVMVAFALVVFAFSLENAPGPDTGGPGSGAFSAAAAMSTLTGWETSAPAHGPGSPGDEAVAQSIATSLSRDGFTVSQSVLTARTAAGTRAVQNVTATLAGGSNAAIVVVAPRGPGAAGLSASAVLVQLGRLLSSSIQSHTIVLASTGDELGGAGVRALVGSLTGPVDAVLVLGDMAAPTIHQPLVQPFSGAGTLAPIVLRKTVQGALSAQGAPSPSSFGVVGQLLQLGYPMSLGGQVPFLRAGLPALQLSAAGERAPAPLDLADGVQTAKALQTLGALGSALTAAVAALDASPPVPPPSAYLLVNGKVIPSWSIRVVVLAFILPVLIAAIDGLARARRRGHALLPWLGWALAGAGGFLLAAVVVVLARVTGLLATAPGGPVPAGVGGPHGGGVATLALVALALLLGAALRPRLAALIGARRSWRRPLEETPAAGVAVPLVLSIAALAIWSRNPFAAIVLIPALHLWQWVGGSELPLPRTVKLPLALLGLLLPAAAVVYYALNLHLGMLGVAWNGVLMVAGGQIPVLSAVLWSVVGGCVLAVFALALAPALRGTDERVPITVRGPISYAGPGSLGGTESAMRR